MRSYLYSFFQTPQYFDSEGRLTTGRHRKHVRKINASVYFRLNEKVAYTLPDRFR